MPFYATRADCLAYTEGLTVLAQDNAAFDRLIDRAELDIDSLLAPVIPNDITGRKIVPADLRVFEAAALRRAVCAQVEWRLVVGESRLSGDAAPAVVKRIKGPDFEKEFAIDPAQVGEPRRYGPKVRGELEPIAHLRVLTGRAGA